MSNSEKPAFPADDYNLGLTKREYFASMAMQGLLARPVNLEIEINVIQSIQLADKLLIELSKK